MKRILLAGTALVGVAALATPAHADLKLDLGGYFRGYAVYADNDEAGTAGSSDELRTFDFKKDAEVHFTGETTTDMGLTVGVHSELKLTGNATPGQGGSLFAGGQGAHWGPGYGASTPTDSEDSGQPSIVDESYIYFSGGWGRVNFGSEDGAAYLLQVAAPSADSNVDGLRPTIQGFSLDAINDGTINENWWDPQSNWWATSQYNAFNSVLGYDNADFRQTERITYLTPKWNGFQAGVSYAPKPGQQGTGANVATGGMSYDDQSEVPLFENLWEVSARWDGEFSGVGISAGGGYSHASNGAGYNATGNNFGSDDLVTWDAGLNLTWQGWSLGGAYLNSNTANSADDNEYRVWDVGLGWDNGPWHAGASWWQGTWEENAWGGYMNGAGTELQVDRYTVGGGYTYGPGMSFRGAVAWINVDNHGAVGTEPSPIQVTLGTDVNF